MSHQNKSIIKQSVISLKLNPNQALTQISNSNQKSIFEAYSIRTRKKQMKNIKKTNKEDEEENDISIQSNKKQIKNIYNLKKIDDPLARLAIKLKKKISFFQKRRKFIESEYFLNIEEVCKSNKYQILKLRDSIRIIYNSNMSIIDSYFLNNRDDIVNILKKFIYDYQKHIYELFVEDSLEREINLNYYSEEGQFYKKFLNKFLDGKTCILNKIFTLDIEITYDEVLLLVIILKNILDFNEDLDEKSKLNISMSQLGRVINDYTQLNNFNLSQIEKNEILNEELSSSSESNCEENSSMSS